MKKVNPYIIAVTGLAVSSYAVGYYGARTEFVGMPEGVARQAFFMSVIAVGFFLLLRLPLWLTYKSIFNWLSMNIGKFNDASINEELAAWGFNCQVCLILPLCFLYVCLPRFIEPQHHLALFSLACAIVFILQIIVQVKKIKSTLQSTDVQALLLCVLSPISLILISSWSIVSPLLFLALLDSVNAPIK